MTQFFSHKVWKTPAFVSQISPFSIFSLSVRSINITENIMKKQEGVLDFFLSFLEGLTE